MEKEEDDATKSYNNSLSFMIILLPVAVVVAVVAFVGYLSFPTIIHSVQVFTVWFDWLCFVIRNVFFVLVFLNALIFLIYFLSPKTTEKNKPETTYDDYFATAVIPSVVVVRPSSENHFREMKSEVEKYDNGPMLHLPPLKDGPVYKETVPEFKAVKECSCYDRRVVMEEESYRKTRSEKKARKVEYRRMKSEKSGRMEVLSSEEFQMTVETFITEKKKLMLSHQHGGFDRRQTGFVDQWQTGFPNGFVDRWQTGGVRQWQTGGPQWRNDVVQWQELPNDGTDGNYYSPIHRLEGGSGSSTIGSGLDSVSDSYLALSN